jgi:hypothetical protein
MVAWSVYHQAFDWDGSLRDIYVQETTIEDWRVLFAALRQAYRLEYAVDGETRPLPQQVDEIFATTGDAACTLYLHTVGVLFASHFFTVDEIEFDIDPREVASQAALDAVTDFLQLIGDTLGKRVLLTEENAVDRVLITYDPVVARFEICQVP